MAGTISVWADPVRAEEMSDAVMRAVEEGHLSDESPAAIFHDFRRMRARIAEVAEQFPAGALHTVAIKANPLPEVLRALVESGAGLEAASIEEVHLALAAGCAAGRIVFDSPAKTIHELRMAMTAGVRINADNFEELKRIAQLREELPWSRSVFGLRVNPLVGSGVIRITSVATPNSKFGVALDLAHEAFTHYEWLTTVHVHAGSQGCPLEMLTSAVARAAALAAAFPQVDTIDIGGGLAAAYRPEDQPPSVAEYADALRRKVPSLFSGALRIITEFGRSIHAPCGWAVSRVEYVKDAGDERLAVIHLGADFLLRRAYHPDDWYHGFVVLDAHGRPKRETPEPWSIVGPLCFGGDVLARRTPLPPIEAGDFVVVRDTGAYTLSLWSRHCSRALPVVLAHDGDRIHVVKKRETASDVVAFWS